MYLLHLVSSSPPPTCYIQSARVNQEFCTVLYVQLKLTVSDVKSAGSSDILATARVESLPTSALYGASFP